MEFLTIYCFVFLLKMKPWGSFQVNEATNVVFMILSGCFISEIVLNLSFWWVKKNTCKIRLHVYTSLRAGVARSGQPIKTLNDKFSLSENIVRPIKGRERWFFTEWNFIVLDADWLLLIRNDYYAHPYRWINLYSHIISIFFHLNSFYSECSSLLQTSTNILQIIHKFILNLQTKIHSGFITDLW